MYSIESIIIYTNNVLHNFIHIFPNDINHTQNKLWLYRIKSLYYLE